MVSLKKNSSCETLMFFLINLSREKHILLFCDKEITYKHYSTKYFRKRNKIFFWSEPSVRFYLKEQLYVLIPFWKDGDTKYNKYHIVGNVLLKKLNHKNRGILIGSRIQHALGVNLLSVFPEWIFCMFTSYIIWTYLKKSYNTFKNYTFFFFLSMYLIFI